MTDANTVIYRALEMAANVRAQAGQPREWRLSDDVASQVAAYFGRDQWSEPATLLGIPARSDSDLPLNSIVLEIRVGDAAERIGRA